MIGRVFPRDRPTPFYYLLADLVPPPNKFSRGRYFILVPTLARFFFFLNRTSLPNRLRSFSPRFNQNFQIVLSIPAYSSHSLLLTHLYPPTLSTCIFYLFDSFLYRAFLIIILSLI